MRLRLWALAALLLLLFSGCNGDNGKTLVFFYDQEFGKMAEFAPDMFSGHTEPLFTELSNAAKESDFSFKPVSVDILQEDYISAFRERLPQPGSKVIITSFLYNVPELQELLDSFQTAVVGSALDIPIDKLRIIGNGFSLLTDEGRMLSSTGQKIRFVAMKSGFQERIVQAFLDGAGPNVEVLETELNANSFIVPISDSLIVFSYGPYFKSFLASRTRKEPIRVVNYPGYPQYADQNLQKRADAFICYDFLSSFKSSLFELSSDKAEKKSFYSFDLVRR